MDLFGEEELDRVFTHYKGVEENIIKEEDVESDKSEDSGATSESDFSDMDDLSQNELDDLYVNLKNKNSQNPKTTKRKRNP